MGCLFFGRCKHESKEKPWGTQPWGVGGSEVLWADPSFPAAAGKQRHPDLHLDSFWISPGASQLTASILLACGYRNYCSLNGQSFSKSQNKYLGVIMTAIWAPLLLLSSFSSQLGSLQCLWCHGHAATRMGKRCQAAVQLSITLSAESLCKAKPGGRSWVLLWSSRTRSPPAACNILCNDFFTPFSAFFWPRFLLQLSRMPTLSCRLTMPGWQPMTSGPSKCKALRERKGQGSMLHAVLYAPGAAPQLLLPAGGHRVRTVLHCRVLCMHP